MQNTMTKKDFELIAKILHVIQTMYQDNQDEKIVIDKTCQEFAGHLFALYPRFNKEKFLKACGVEVNKYYTCKRCGKEAIKGSREQERDFIFSDICIACNK